MRKNKKSKKVTKWYKLDNTANIFPIITNESMSNVFRASVTLKEDINPELLQLALDKILPWFNVFNARLRRGMFWYYFETNHKPSPRVHEESTFPCSYINSNKNNNYLFRVTYYKKRINLEVFHVLTDGAGALTFLKELAYQYLRLSYPTLKEIVPDSLCSDTSLDFEDSYNKNYKKRADKLYKTGKAYIIKSEALNPMEIGVIHGYINMQELKSECKKMNISINQFLVGTLMWSIYKECLHEQPAKRPISICVPVNLRPYFNSTTTRNFFAIVSAVFNPVRDHYTYEEVVEEASNSLKEQITKEHLEKILSYNVSSERRLIVRAIPLFIKNIVVKAVWRASAKGNTATLTNLGIINVRKEYEEYIEQFHIVLSTSPKQNFKCSVSTYNDTIVFTFSSPLADVSVQKAFFRKLAEKNISVSIESNGVYYEHM